MVQANPLQIEDKFEKFEIQVEQVLKEYPSTELLMFPELHLYGDGTPDRSRTSALENSAEPLSGERTELLKRLAKRFSVWLVPGSICERGEDGKLYNTLVLLSPNGDLVASYRKIFPWRPSEPYAPGAEFVVANLEGAKIGLTICYDAWFPEVTRELAWRGSELMLNVVKTTTPDRKQEIVLAQANAIVNQVFFASVNVAAPTGLGGSLVVGPEGEILVKAQGAAEEVLNVVIDLERVRKIRDEGTAGENRMWSQFRPGDPVIPLSIYEGRINPSTWEPK